MRRRPEDDVDRNQLRIKKALERSDAAMLLRAAVTEARRRDHVEILTALHGLSMVVHASFSDDTETACLRMKCGEYRMEFGTEFVRKFVETPADLLHLVLHETLHRIRGDLGRRMPADVPPAAARALANLAADMLVNAELENSILGATPGYFRKLYPRDRFPANLLLPPWRLLKIKRETARAMDRRQLVAQCAERFRTAQGIASTDPTAAAAVYASAWAGEPTFDGLLRALHHLLPSLVQEDILWLGHHGESDDDDPDMDGQIREWFHAQGVMRAGYGEKVLQEETDDPPLPRRAGAFYEAVRAAIVEDAACPRTSPSIGLERGVVPYLGRREAFLLSCGAWPTFFRSPMPVVDEDDRRVHVYIDASYSTRNVWAVLYGLAIHLKEEIGDRVWIFSNAVHELKKDGLRRGIVHTTGGTDFNCVAEHAMDRRFRRILIVTDGEAPLDGALARRLQLQQTELFVVLTARNEHCPLLGMARRSWVLPQMVNAV